VCDPSNDPRGVIRLEPVLEKWEVADDQFEIFGVNGVLNGCAVQRSR